MLQVDEVVHEPINQVFKTCNNVNKINALNFSIKSLKSSMFMAIKKCAINTIKVVLGATKI